MGGRKKLRKEKIGAFFKRNNMRNGKTSWPNSKRRIGPASRNHKEIGEKKKVERGREGGRERINSAPDEVTKTTRTIR